MAGTCSSCRTRISAPSPADALSAESSHPPASAFILSPAVERTSGLATQQRRADIWSRDPICPEGAVLSWPARWPLQRQTSHLRIRAISRQGFCAAQGSRASSDVLARRPQPPVAGSVGARAPSRRRPRRRLVGKYDRAPGRESGPIGRTAWPKRSRVRGQPGWWKRSCAPGRRIRRWLERREQWALCPSRSRGPATAWAIPGEHGEARWFRGCGTASSPGR